MICSEFSLFKTNVKITVATSIVYLSKKYKSNVTVIFQKGRNFNTKYSDLSEIDNHITGKSNQFCKSPQLVTDESDCAFTESLEIEKGEHDIDNDDSDWKALHKK